MNFLFFLASGVFHGGSVSPPLRFYCIFHYSIHFTLEWSPIQVLTNHGPNCLTSVILLELVFPTWYCRSFVELRFLVAEIVIHYFKNMFYFKIFKSKPETQWPNKGVFKSSLKVPHSDNLFSFSDLCPTSKLNFFFHQ